MNQEAWGETAASSTMTDARRDTLYYEAYYEASRPAQSIKASVCIFLKML